MKNKMLVLLVWLVINSSVAFGESNFSFRAAPSIENPLGVENFNSGMGAAISLDWSFLTFINKFDTGLTVGGNFANLPFVTGESLTLMEGKGGIFLRYRPLDRLAARISANAGGYQFMRGGTNSTDLLVTFTLGGEFLLSPYFSLFADGAYTYRVFSAYQNIDTNQNVAKPLSTIGMAVGLRLNLSEIMGGRARIQLERIKQNHVFPVSWAWYEHNPIATVTVTNEEPNTIRNINLSFFMDRYMGEPFTFAVIQKLDPGETVEVPVTALFNEALMNQSQAINATGILQLQYRSLGARKETSSPIQMPVFNRNTMSWDDDRRAAAFVSSRDYAVRLFASNVAGAVDTMTGQGNTPKNVLYAVALFEALRLYRLNYIIDPSSSYAVLSDDETALDSLNFPYETLYYSGGDCDDLSILYCSLLEALGVESAFVTVPGHIYTAFAVGDDSWQPNNRDIITVDGKRWIPIEATVTGRGFAQGWQFGIRQWRNAGNNAELFPIRECWEIYPSVTVPASGDNPPQIPAWSGIINAVNNELRAIIR